MFYSLLYTYIKKYFLLCENLCDWCHHSWIQSQHHKMFCSRIFFIYMHIVTSVHYLLAPQCFSFSPLILNLAWFSFNWNVQFMFYFHFFLFICFAGISEDENDELDGDTSTFYLLLDLDWIVEDRKATSKRLRILVCIANWVMIPFVENAGRLDDFELCRLSSVAIGYDGMNLNYVIFLILIIVYR